MFPWLSWLQELILTTTIITTIATLTSIYRIVDGRDGLLWLQFANIAGAVLIILPTHAVSMLETARGITFIGLLLLGAAIHAVKFPER